MDLLQRIKNGQNDPSAPFIIFPVTGLFEDGLDIHTLQIFHDYVTGSILFEEIGDFHNALHIMQGSNAPRLGEELLQTALKTRHQFFIRDHDRQTILPAATVLFRIKLLDRNFPL